VGAATGLHDPTGATRRSGACPAAGTATACPAASAAATGSTSPCMGAATATTGVIGSPRSRRTAGRRVDYIKHNKLCPVCLKATQGFGHQDRRGLTFYCSRGHSMTGQHLEQDEDVPLWEAVKKAGQYLDSIGQHDMRYLTKQQLLMFSSKIVSAFAEQRADWFERQRHPDDKMAILDDDIPF
jgi:hypothetical protein